MTRFTSRRRGQSGQSAVEYLIVVAILVSSLVAMPSVFASFAETMQNKYRSYSFGIAISDPPSSAFDDQVASDANKVKKVMDVLGDLERWVQHPSLPDPKKPAWPEKKAVEDFERLLHHF